MNKTRCKEYKPYPFFQRSSSSRGLFFAASTNPTPGVPKDRVMLRTRVVLRRGRRERKREGEEGRERGWEGEEEGEEERKRERKKWE